MSDTPETDAVENNDDWAFRSEQVKWFATLARKLERERDQARLEATRYRNLAMELANEKGDIALMNRIITND